MLSDSCGPFVHLVYPQMATEELLAYLAGELTGTAGAADSQPPADRPADRALPGRQRPTGPPRRRGRGRAHLLDDSRTLEALRLLLNFQPEGQQGLTLLLVGQPGILPMLDHLPQLEERLAVKCLLRPLEPARDGPVRRPPFASGRRGTREIFDPSALETLHRLTHGVPRRINRLCDLSLLIGYAEERSTIGGSQIEAISDELVNVAPE